MVVSFAGGAATNVPITLRYVPASPYYLSGPTATVDIRVQGPSAWRQAILAAVGLALAAWIVLKWRRAPKSERTDSVLPPPPSGRPEILVLDRPSGLKGWRGVVNDAPAAKAGIKPGDVLTRVGDRTVTSPAELLASVAALKPRSQVEVAVQRSGKAMSFQLAVAQRPKPQQLSADE